MNDTIRTLIFSSDKQEGALPVTDEYGRLLARVSAPSSRAHLKVTDPDGSGLCLASVRWWGLGAWPVTDVRAKPLLSMTTNLFKSRAVVHLDGDGELVLHGNGWGDGFTIRDADGRYVARTSSEPPSPGAARHPDDMVLVEIPGVLHLAEIIS